MTLTDTIAMVLKFLDTDLDSFQAESPTTQQSVDVINEALRRTAKKIVLIDNKITMTLSNGVADYNLTDSTLFTGVGSANVRILKPIHVVINNNTLSGPNGVPGLWTMEQLDRLIPSWRTASAATPIRALRVGGGQYLRLSPAPSAAVVSAGENFLSAYYAPANMTTGQGSSQLPIHEDTHWGVAYLAAFLHAVPAATEAEGWQRLKAFKSEWFETIADIAAENTSSQSYAGSVEDLGMRDTISL